VSTVNAVSAVTPEKSSVALSAASIAPTVTFSADVTVTVVALSKDKAAIFTSVTSASEEAKSRATEITLFAEIVSTSASAVDVSSKSEVIVKLEAGAELVAPF
jgi:hypothetical protein